MNFAQRGGHHFDIRVLLDDPIDHLEEDVRIELRLAVHVRSRDAEALLQVFFVADQARRRYRRSCCSTCWAAGSVRRPMPKAWRDS